LIALAGYGSGSPAGMVEEKDLWAASACRQRPAWSPTSRTFTNPILPGDHPDMNIYVEGDDFYLTGSSFNMSPNVEILHSKDLIHWERVSRVVDPDWSGLQSSIAGGGTWGGFIVKIAGGYRIYFAVNFHQYFAEAPSLAGPWGAPIELNAFPYTVPDGTATFNRGNGYDDSVFIDDDGKTYLLVKAGQCKWNGKTDGAENNFGINLITEIDPATGMLKEDSTLDLSFVNWNVANGGCGDPENDPANANTSNWAEGPTMVKRDGYYYYFVSTHTGCGGEEYIWRSARLSDNPEDWTPLGRFLVSGAPFGGAQHSTTPLQIADGTWWAFLHSYECEGGWLGLARQGVLSQVTWTVDGVPVANGDWAAPAPAPDLPPSGIPFLLPVNDDFSAAELRPAWTFYGNMPAGRYSVTDRPGWLRIKPAPGETRWAVQKDALHSSAMVVKLDFTPQAEGDAAGVRLGNPVPEEEVSQFDSWTNAKSLEVSVARVWADGGDKIRFALGPFAHGLAPAPATSAYTPAPASGTVWLKLVHTHHQATGWFSTDRLVWTQVGGAIDIGELDDYDALVDGWVGNQAGVFASNRNADFDLFSYRDGFTEVPAAEPDQQSGASVVSSAAAGAVLGDLENDDWAMYGSVDLGSGGVHSKAIELRVASPGNGGRPVVGAIEIWLDPLAGGPRIASCPVRGTGGWESWKTVRCALRASETHEVYLRVRGGAGELLRLASLRFVPGR
jgi:beta-xylosidase